MEQIRSFIAIELPDELKLELTQLEARLKQGEQPWLKWVDPYSIHLTLKFLGNVAASRIDKVIGAMEEAVRGISLFQLTAKDLGVFPSSRRAQIAWVGLAGEIDKLTRLQRRIESSLVPLGFPRESRPFTPHLTLARLRDRASLEERQQFGQLIVSTKFETAYDIKVDAINLMRSKLARTGAIYSRIGSVGLKESGS
jgi:2'-5' RNA ligase